MVAFQRYTVLGIELGSNTLASVPQLLVSDDLWPRPADAQRYSLWQWNNTACSVHKGPASACLIALKPSVRTVVGTGGGVGGGVGDGGIGGDGDGVVGGRRGTDTDTDPAPAAASPDAVDWSLWSAAPVLSNGYTFLGETSKYVSVSPDRFLSITVVSNAVTTSTSNNNTVTNSNSNNTVTNSNTAVSNGILVKLVGGYDAATQVGEEVDLMFAGPDSTLRLVRVTVDASGEWSGLLSM